MAIIDLHIHSAYSDDGEFSIRNIMEQCKAANITYVSITDHNTVRGIPDAISLGAQMGIQVIPGVELDCVHMGRNLHLLGYNFDYTHPTFIEIERQIVEQEKNAAEQKIELIKKVTGIPLRSQEVLAAAVNGIVTGELIAEILLEKEDARQYQVLLPYLSGGVRDDNPYVNFYWDYFAPGKPANVPIQYISLDEANSFLHETGGITVLAHPGQSLPGEYEFLQQVMSVGIDGVEAYSSYHKSTESKYFADMAQQKKWLFTCGSDFHGKIKPSIPLCGHGADENMEIIADALLKRLETSYSSL